MEIRNVQKTGKMHYVYLPTTWCRKYKISSDSKVAISEMNDGSILVAPQIREKRQRVISLTLPSKYRDTLINVIMACYVNPAHAFKIQMEKKIDMKELLSQKNIVSGLEFVELDGEHIMYEASMSVGEPDALLKTLLKKTKNLIYIMLEQYDPEIIRKYEEEIDRSKVLIQKAVITSLVENESTALKAIDLHYTMQLATELERMVDHLIELDRVEKPFLKQLLSLVEYIKDLLDDLDSLTYLKAAHFTKQVLALPVPQPITEKSYHQARIKSYLKNMAEVIFDWAITKLTQAPL